MQTQCPHCETRFRVTESQVNAADGFVRCSVCEEVFNAFEVAEQDEHQPSLLSQTQEQPQEDQAQTPGDEPSAEQANDDAISSNEFEPESDELKNHDPENYEPENYQPEHFESDDNDLEKNKALNEQPPASETIEDAEKTETGEVNKTAASEDSRKDAFDFFDEDDNESLSHVVPEQFKHAYNSDSNSFLSTLFWGIGTLLLIGTLALEYVWFNRDQLNQIPQLQAWTEKLCQHFECKDISIRDPKKIELVSRNVYSHPNEKNALMVNITMKNQADFAQPYPVMQIRFSDVRGGDVAARRFLPDEYLPAEVLQQATPQAQLFEAGTNMTFTMEIQDPGKQAMTYEFDFL